jgi:hypothetical protein
MKSSFHSLIPFLPLFCNCQFRRLDSTQFNSSALKLHILAGWRLETRLILLSWTLLYNNFARTIQKTEEGVFTAPLHVSCVFVAAGMCLPSRWLAMNVYSGVTIPAFGRNVTKLWSFELWYRVVGGYRSFCFHLNFYPEDSGSMFLRFVGTQPRRP